MTPIDLATLLDRLISDGENEIVEFKEGGSGFSTPEIGKYFSALSNEANLRDADAGWLVFGVSDKTRQVVGSSFRPDPEQLHGLKQQIANSAEPPATFRAIHELGHPGGRVLLFEVPPAPRGIPISWNGHYYARNGESLGPLSLVKQDEIRGQGARTDWSAVVVPDARLDHLDPEALAIARDAFAARHSARLDASEVDAWPLATFLKRASLTIDGGITRAALLLLGKRESFPLLSPLLAEITWRLVSEGRAYEHFGLPFLVNTTKAYERIRNFQVRLMQPGTLIQTEIPRYDKAAVLEAIHNAVAHADYRSGSRIVLAEHPDRIVLENAGGFVDGTPEDYVVNDRTPRSYRNPFLVNAMTELNMIDRLGYGIQQIHRSQVRRFLPLPDYDLSDPNMVRLTIYGAVLDTNYTELLMSRTDLPLADVLALDRVQKGQPVLPTAVQRLKRAHLIEGRKPHYHVSSVVAAAADTKADYIRTRAQDDAHYAKLITDYLEKFGAASRLDINKLLWPKLSDALDDQQKRNKITNLLSKMREEGIIRNSGSQQKPRWVLV